MTVSEPKSAVAIRHVNFEDLGSFSEPLAAEGYRIAYCDAGLGQVDDLLSQQAPPDLLVVMGGPIGAYEEDRYPVLIKELAAIERQIEAGLPLIGVCLGAQLIARALGARVHAGRALEIGWGPLTPSPEGEASCLAPLVHNEWQVLHWHGDAFDLPEGATRLAATPATETQAFSYGPAVLGLQFHVEAQSHAIEQWLIGHAAEIAQAGIDPAALRADTAHWGRGLEAAAPEVIKAWFADAALAAG